MLFRWFCCSLLLISPVIGQESGDDQGEQFFEKRIRPVLLEHCIACHSAKKQMGDLSLDHRGGWQKGGESGDVIIPGKPDDSLLLQLIRHEEAGREMPAKAPKLDDQIIADFAQWIRIGAPDPRLEPTDSVPDKERPWNEVRDERARWWSFQPLAARKGDLSGSAAIDAMIDLRIGEQGIVPSALADRRTLLRRLSYTLRGLPPSPGEIAEFLADGSSDAWEKCVDRMLASPRFGEHWARHWMDVVRYADTHGSEDDAVLPFAYRYRDYLIRAFNEDVPFDQLIREHIAGDLIPPRSNQSLGVNESLIGTAFWRFVEFNQTPVDVKREEIVVIDNQIDALGKAFQALTISCARCHDHKFDPISDEDYYALYGILRSSRIGTRIIDPPETFAKHDGELRELAQQLKSLLATQWLAEVDQWPDQIRKANQWLVDNVDDDSKPEEVESKVPAYAWTKTLWKSLQKPAEHPLAPLSQLMRSAPTSFESEWKNLSAKSAQQLNASSQIPASARELFDLRNDVDGWLPVGVGLPSDCRKRAGDFAIQGGSENLVTAILERGFQSNVLSDRHAGVLRSPAFLVDDEVISVLARGSGDARLRLVIENFQGDSLLFGTVNPTLNSNLLIWHRMTIRPQWRGLRAHLELITRDDKPYVGIIKDSKQLEKTDGRSSFGIARVVMHPHSVQMQNTATIPDALWKQECRSDVEMIQSVCEATKNTIRRWSASECSDNDARWLTALIETGIFSARSDGQPKIKSLVERYRVTEQKIPIARRSPGIFDDQCAVNQEFLPRGDHKSAEDFVARRYLEILGGTADDYAGNESGRLRLAEAIADADNPLTARVYVNRVWHWVFGSGIVITVDNFGRMGASPSHPELLDELARQFIECRWSTKHLIRSMVLSKVWQRESTPTPTALEKDPSNRLWSHWRMRRLDAESIRDTMLLLSGGMRTDDGGPGTLVFYRSVLDAKKQPPPGPLDGDNRRSIFLEVRRNFPNEFLVTFDFPKPNAPTGRRSETTVPAQSLTLLNDPFPLQQAQRWASRVCKEKQSDEARVAQFYVECFGRGPTAEEIAQAFSFVAQSTKQTSDVEAWKLYAHALFNFKEMIFLR